MKLNGKGVVGKQQIEKKKNLVSAHRQNYYQCCFCTQNLHEINVSKVKSLSHSLKIVSIKLWEHHVNGCNSYLKRLLL